MTATLYGYICDERQPLGRVRLEAGRLHYYRSDRIPTPVLQRAKEELASDKPRSAWEWDGCRYEVENHDWRPPAKPQRRNTLTGKPVWLVTTEGDKGPKTNEFEGDTAADVEGMLKVMRMKVVKVEPAE